MNIQAYWNIGRNKIGQQWSRLSLRERYLVGGLIGFLTLFTFYQFLYMPLNDAVLRYQSELINDQELLVFMQTAIPRIKINQGEVTPIKVLAKNMLLPTIEETLNQKQLMSFVSELGLRESGEVNVQFKTVDFDQLMIWLVDLRLQYGIQVKELTAIHAELPGMGHVTLLLSM